MKTAGVFQAHMYLFWRRVEIITALAEGYKSSTAQWWI